MVLLMFSLHFCYNRNVTKITFCNGYKQENLLKDIKKAPEVVNNTVKSSIHMWWKQQHSYFYVTNKVLNRRDKLPFVSAHKSFVYYVKYKDKLMEPGARSN